MVIMYLSRGRRMMVRLAPFFQKGADAERAMINDHLSAIPKLRELISYGDCSL
jgi:hypothetical protein